MAGQAALCSREEVRSKIKAVECNYGSGKGKGESKDLAKTMAKVKK